MDILKLANIFSKIASDPPKFNYPGQHVYNDIIEESILPKNWKDRFEAILNIRLRVLSAISHDASRTENKHKVNEFNILKRTQPPLISITRKLIDDVREVVNSDKYNWEKYYNDLYLLEAYEFFMGSHLYYEVSDWVFQVHGIITHMFRILENHYKNEWKISQKSPPKPEKEYLYLSELEDDQATYLEN